MWETNMESLWNFRKSNGKLPSSYSKDSEEKSLYTWYRKQLKNYRVKIHDMNDPVKYDSFGTFIQTFGLNKGRVFHKIKVDGKMVFKSHKIMLESNEPQIITVTTINEDDMNKFLKILNDSLKEYGKEPVDLNLIKYKFKKDYSKNENIDWREMPVYEPSDILTCPKIKLYIPKDSKFRLILINKINQNITDKTKSIHFPEKVKTKTDKMYISKQEIVPKYPIYVISYKRWEDKNRLTIKYLEWANIDYKVVIKSEEYENYASVIDSNKILVLPEEYSSKDQGGVPARNFVLHHSRNEGHKRHWILDDNIDGYCYVHKDKRYKVKSGAAFRMVEDYVDRYENIKIAGHNYTSFIIPSSLQPPIYLNNRVYSSILLSNDIDIEWRGKYNEDTDLCLRLFKEGYPTVLFNIISANKIKTLSMKGGNAEIYSEDGVYLKAKSLYDQHPDVVKIGNRFGRVHHIVNYKPFKNIPLLYNKNLVLKDEPNDYGLILADKD